VHAISLFSSSFPSFSFSSIDVKVLNFRTKEVRSLPAVDDQRRGACFARKLRKSLMSFAMVQPFLMKDKTIWLTRKINVPGWLVANMVTEMKEASEDTIRNRDRYITSHIWISLHKEFEILLFIIHVDC
jgi:hypothetical protein